MAENGFAYEEWVADALRSVLRRALSEAAEHGLPGEHHFYINFKTSEEGVSIPPFLRAQYPDEITIALQHQFEGLIVDDEGFSVTLSFAGRKQDLTVPFSAVTSFTDPSVNFGLQIVSEAVLGQDLESAPPEPALADNAMNETPEHEEGEGERPSEDQSDEDQLAASAEIITLDAFRKQ